MQGHWRLHEFKSRLLFFFPIQELCPFYSQQTIREKVWILSKAFLCFVLDLPTLELKCHLMPFAVSLCVFIIQPTTPRWCASQQAQSRASNLFICGEKGQANTLAAMLEVLYLSTGPNIWAARLSVHCPIVCGSARERRLFFKRVCAQHAHTKVNTQPLCLCVCVCVGGSVSRLWRSQYSMAPSLLTSKHDLWCHDGKCHSIWPCGVTACVICLLY